MKLLKHIAIFLLMLFTTQSCAKNEVYIRVSQVGFAQDDIKIALILSTIKLDGKTFQIIDSKNKAIEFKDTIRIGKGEFGNFKYTYEIDFSKYQKEGSYKIKVESYYSPKFEIGKNLFAPIVKELMRFFPVQRCGYTNPSEHEVCHIADATSLIDGNKLIAETKDVTGGWHDAGDYVKFLNTTAVTTYTLLFAYENDNKKFGFDFNKNNVPDILEEAKVGLDWMLRTQTDDDRFITQVQSLQDHEVGWRLPENDTLAFNRPGYIGIGKNLIGIYSATMALASKIWNDKLNHPEFSEKCLVAAERYYNIKDEVIDIDSSGTGQYFDKSFEGKLALGAIELYEATKERKYLLDAQKYGKKAGAEYWWSYGNISTFAHYKLAKYDTSFLSLIEQSLNFFNSNRNSKFFGETVTLGWGSNVTKIGTAIQAMLYAKRVKNSKFDSLSISVRDYLLGKNQWGISFVSNIGEVYSKHLHHQVSFINKITLPGGFAAGPTSKSSLESYKLPYTTEDKYSKFQTEFAYYRDDKADYVTNEPTIIGNAMAILLFGYFID
ncbi:MAG: glycoside hydrolase family 9 protein [Melioribacteraceae bacterium]|nr:glycoside hydrolase family 9 protein [Melioribacteraceae bacterium]